MNNNEKNEPIVNEEYMGEETADNCCSIDEQCNGCCCEGGQERSEGESCCSEKDPALEELEQKLKEAEAKVDEYIKLAQRVQADFENYKRRNRNAIADAYREASAEVVGVFLPVLDNLDRAIDSITAAGADESIIKGIELVRRQFLDTLTKLGVEEIDALGKPFDPELHNAVGQVEAEEGQEENTVAAVLQKGYQMNGRVIRYSMVQVAR
ncbi:MAG TPA: nucleotide exchange factor GrpE [Clostridiales bacterium]|nr:nucleotide exchange factor GrpE [Clostridiales bacterium]